MENHLANKKCNTLIFTVYRLHNSEILETLINENNINNFLAIDSEVKDITDESDEEKMYRKSKEFYST